MRSLLIYILLEIVIRFFLLLYRTLQLPPIIIRFSYSVQLKCVGVTIKHYHHYDL